MNATGKIGQIVFKTVLLSGLEAPSGRGRVQCSGVYRGRPEIVGRATRAWLLQVFALRANNDQGLSSPTVPRT